MQSSNQLIRQCTRAVIVGVTLSGLTSPLVIASPRLFSNRALFTIAGRNDNPRTDTGGPPRGDCPRASIPLTSLVDSRDSGSRGGVTLAARPTFWLYFPYTIVPNGVKPDRIKGQIAADAPIRVMIQEIQGKKRKTVATILFKARNTVPGVIKLSLPESVPALIPDTNYYWFFDILCDGLEGSSFFTVESWVRRETISPALREQIAKARPEEQSRLYLEHDIWYEGIDSLARWVQQNPTNLGARSQWNAVLKRYGLEELVDQPIVEFALDEVEVK